MDLGNGLRVLHLGRDQRERGDRAPTNHPPRYVVIDKPSGMLSVPGKGEHKQDCVASRIRAAFEKDGASGPLIVHRLDMDTSGLMVLGLDADSQRELSRQFEEREVEKEYIALVEGHIGAESGLIDEPMRLDVGRRPYQIIDLWRGREARTRWRLLALETDRSRVLLTPETGRTHQLRVHLAHIGHPIVGDVLYGRAHRNEPRLMLHASRLAFTEPWTSGRRVEFTSAAPF